MNKDLDGNTLPSLQDGENTSSGFQDAMFAYLQEREKAAGRGLEWHLANSNVSYEQYSYKRRIELGVKAMSKLRIYLDQRYWIYCRDARLGRPQKPMHSRIWEQLRRLVAEGRVVCPVAYAVLEETCAPEKLATRQEIAETVDLLCAGLALQPPQLLMKIEVDFALKNLLFPCEKTLPLTQRVWTSIGWVGGEQWGHLPAFDAATNLAIQKTMFDCIGEMPFSGIISAFKGPNPVSREELRRHSDEMNKRAQAEQWKISSFKAAFEIEVEGTMDIVDQFVASWFAHHKTMLSKDRDKPLSDEEFITIAANTRNEVGRFLLNRKLANQMPWAHIGASVHAAIRSKGQKYRCNDGMDHMHAMAALPYCDVFLTERSMGSLLSTAPLCLDREYQCKVLWEEEHVLEYLCAM